jgi:hypothetical protein
MEASMWREHRDTAILNGVKAITKYIPHQRTAQKTVSECAPFNKSDLVRRHPMQVLPLMALIRLHAKRLALVVGVHQRDGEHILLHVDAAVVAQRDGPVHGGVLDGAPEVDDLEAPRQQLRHLRRGEMAVHARDCRRGGLVDVRLRHGLAVLGAVVDLAGAAAADSYGIQRLMWGMV